MQPLLPIVFAVSSLLAPEPESTEPGSLSRTCTQVRESEPGSVLSGSAVGFTLLETRDQTRPAFEPGVPAARGRAVRIWLWYPTGASDAKTISFGRYAELNDGDFALGEGATEKGDFAAGPLARSLSPEELAALLATRTRAIENAPASGARSPLIVLGQGLYYESPIAHALLAEFLASHGFVVATCPLVGPRSRLIDLDGEHLETQVRDLECVIAEARRRSDVDEEKLGVFGFDMGGMSALILAMRRPDVDAMATLDAGILYPHPSGIPASSPHYDPARFRIPWLHATRASAVSDPDASGSLFESAVHAERWLVLVEGMLHRDFTSFALIEGKRPVTGYWPEALDERAGRHAAVAALVLRFFRAFLAEDEGAHDDLLADPAEIVGDLPLTVTHRRAQSAPPTVGDFVNAVFAHGGDRAVALVRAAHAEHPDCELVREATLNRLGYQFLYFWGHADVAVRTFEITGELYPDSANAHDSLGEGYFFRGDRERAAASYERALALDPASESAKTMLRRLGR